MKICFLRTSRLLKIVTLVAVTIGMAVGFLVLDNLIAQAAPPTPGPITILGIIHQCNDPLLKEEPLNDTYQSAELLQAGQVQTHTLDSGGDLGTHDKDWFEFTVLAGQVFTLSTTMPTNVLTLTNQLTTTEISLFTSTTTALSDNPAYTSTNELGWVAPGSPVTQTFWARVRNPYAFSQDPSESFCDVIYNVELRLLGDLDNPGTQKLAEAGAGRTLTYTLILSNTGETLSLAVVTDAFPTGVNVLTVTVSPTSVTTNLLTSATDLSWTGWVPAYSNLQFTINATVTQDITDVRNTAWITAQQVISRTSENVTFGPSGVFLPIILKNY
jgi:uncharacterized repeat protein (TIGR01451 family)